jgi:hypothetical protein
MPLTEVYRNTVEAPPITPPRYSLVTAVETVDEPGVRWEGGYSFLSALGGGGGAGELDECFQWFANPNAEQQWMAYGYPVVVWAEAPCHSTLGSRSRDWQGMARRALLARQSAYLASWLAQQHLNQAVTNSGGQVGDSNPPDVVAQLEDWLAAQLYGPVGTLHMSPGTLAAVVGAGLARLDGARWVTPIGTVIAADAGYANDLEVGGENAQAIVATGPVRVRLGPIEVPDPTSREAIDPSTNTVRLVAWRPALIELDYGGPDVLVSTGPDTFGPAARGGRLALASASTPA